MIEKLFNLIPRGLAGFIEKHLKKIPYVKNKIDKEINGFMKDLETSLKPYKETFKAHTHIPETPLEKLDVLPAGIGIANPTALFKSNSFNELINELDWE